MQQLAKTLARVVDARKKIWSPVNRRCLQMRPLALRGQALERMSRIASSADATPYLERIRTPARQVLHFAAQLDGMLCDEA